MVAMWIVRVYNGNMGRLIEVADENKIKMMERWYAEVGYDVALALREKVREGKLTWYRVWRQAMPAVRCSRRQGELAAEYAMRRFMRKNEDIIGALLEREGLGIDRIVEKLREKLEAYRVDTYKGQVTVDPETGEPLKHADNVAQLRALDMLISLHGLKKEKQGAQVLIYINAPQIQKPEGAGTGHVGKD